MRNSVVCEFHDPTMHFRPHETLFFGDNLFNICPICFKFSQCTFQLKRQFSPIWSLNPRPGRGGSMRPPLRFFEDSVKTAARSAAKFGTAYGATFLHMT